ncbi:MAG: DNA-binding transcriptional regulator GbsR (MarR family) [Cyclobacteriaceae bacterium]|jgi:DNA-binding transcriptional regulator GbsR (MarR family)
MEYAEAKATLIQAWGTLGSSWGINRTMAQIHILLLISPDPLSTENVMDELSISRGNANMNLRSLLEWGVIYKNLVPGERREFFSPEKDIWELARIVAKERRKRELEPAMKILAQVNSLAHDGSEEVNELKKVTDDLMSFSKMANQMLDKMSQLEQNRLLRFMLSV